MTVTHLVLAWVPVAVWFVIATVGTGFIVGLLAKPPGQKGLWMGWPLPLLKWRLVEAVLLSMLGSLWFDSLGTGAWWLVFLLVGAIAAIPAWLARASLVEASADVARYVLAGAILAWRLG